MELGELDQIAVANADFFLAEYATGIVHPPSASIARCRLIVAEGPDLRKAPGPGSSR